MAEFIEVREVGLRDGIQNIKTVVPTDLKLAWIKAEVAAGVRDIEVCSFVPPKAPAAIRRRRGGDEARAAAFPG